MTSENKKKTEGSRGPAANEVPLLLIKSLTLIMQTSQSEFMKTSWHKKTSSARRDSSIIKVYEQNMSGFVCFVFWFILSPRPQMKYNKTKGSDWKRSKQNHTK